MVCLKFSPHLFKLGRYYLLRNTIKIISNILETNRTIFTWRFAISNSAASTWSFVGLLSISCRSSCLLWSQFLKSFLLRSIVSHWRIISLTLFIRLSVCKTPKLSNTYIYFIYKNLIKIEFFEKNLQLIWGYMSTILTKWHIPCPCFSY